MKIIRIIPVFFFPFIIMGLQAPRQIKTAQLPASALSQPLTVTDGCPEKPLESNNLFPKRKQMECAGLRFKVNLTADSSFISNIVLFDDAEKIDTVFLEGKRIVPGLNGKADIIIADYNFDNYCDFIIQDITSASHGTFSQYYYLYNHEKNKFIQETSIPERVGHVEVDTIKKGLTIYCSYNDCKGTFKFMDKRFQLIDGVYRNEP